MFKKFFKKKSEIKEYKVVIPEENYILLKYKSENLPGICRLNDALRDFQPKEVFSWHLSVIIDFEDMIENGMPSQIERDIVDPFCDELDEIIKSNGIAPRISPPIIFFLFFLPLFWVKSFSLIIVFE